MFDKRLSMFSIGGLALLAAAIPLTLTLATAQVAPPPDQGVRPGQGGFGQGQPGAAGPGGQFGQRQPGMMMGGGGAAAIVADNMFLYIVQGNRLVKVSKADLKVLGETQLGGPMPGGARQDRGAPPPPPGTAKD